LVLFFKKELLASFLGWLPMLHAVRGQTLRFTDDPFRVDPASALRHDADGAVVFSDGVIVAVGPAAETLAGFPGVAVDHYPDDLILAGFVDVHVHYPQTRMIASYGKQLLDWLNTYTFPAELAFANPIHAAATAELFLDELVRNGITTAAVYGTVHPHSIDAFFTASTKRRMRMAAGKVLMDRHAPDGLMDTAQSGYDESAALIGRWHNRDRCTYVITPRFAPTSTPAQLEAAGALWKAHPDALIQTHLSENQAEIAWVKSLFPAAPDYLGVYEMHGLVGPGAIFGHAIHLTPREIELFRNSGAATAHCPTSNLFIGSGLFDMSSLRAADDPVQVGLGTDVGAGTSFSMFATMKATYEVAQLRGFSLHPAQAYWLATVGGARTLRMADRVGNLAPGLEADVIVIDPKSRPLIAARMENAGDIFDVLFAQMILADDRAIKATYVMGEKLAA
jgi:guanine deaminase